MCDVVLVLLGSEGTTCHEKQNSMNKIKVTDCPESVYICVCVCVCVMSLGISADPHIEHGSLDMTI